MRAFNWEIFVKVVAAFAPYAWPGAAIVVALVFRGELNKLLGRITKFGGAEFSPAAQELATQQVLPNVAAGQLLPPAGAPQHAAAPEPTPVTANVAASSAGGDITVATTGAGAPAPSDPQNPTWRDRLLEIAQLSDALSEQVADDAEAFAPELSIFALAIVFEKELRRFVELNMATGALLKQEVLDLGLRQSLEFAARLLPHRTVKAARSLIKVRNEVAHGMKVDPASVEPARAVAKSLIADLRSRNAILVDRVSST